MKLRRLCCLTLAAAMLVCVAGCKEEKPKTEMDLMYENRPVSLKQMEELDRGFVAVPAEEGMFLSWRFLGTDVTDIKFNVYKNGTLLNKKPIADVTNYTDTSYDGAKDADVVYTLVPVVNKKEQTDKTETAINFGNEYLSVPVKQHEIGDYNIDDASVGDLDGDGQYEIVVRRNPANMSVQSRDVYPLLEAYELDGTYMWTIDIGPNEINTIDINFIV